MTTDRLLELTADLPAEDRTKIINRATVLESLNNWPAERANRAAWTEYVERRDKTQTTML
jgi:hypothetical protein